MVAWPTFSSSQTIVEIGKNRPLFAALPFDPGKSTDGQFGPARQQPTLQLFDNRPRRYHNNDVPKECPSFLAMHRHQALAASLPYPQVDMTVPRVGGLAWRRFYSSLAWPRKPTPSRPPRRETTFLEPGRSRRVEFVKAVPHVGRRELPNLPREVLCEEVLKQCFGQPPC